MPHIHELTGCSPAPLANYLKALAILRLVAEQKDPQARGWWRGTRFYLLTQLSKEQLEQFFLNDYQPTPLLSPWNKGSGFYKANDPGMAPIENSRAARFDPFRQAIAGIRKVLDEISVADAVIRSIKACTKTGTKTFQTEEQRQLLADDSVYQETVADTRRNLQRSDLTESLRTAMEEELRVLEHLVAAGKRPPGKSEAEKLKNSSGYKRLLAAADRRFKALKSALIPKCRQLWRGPHAAWMAAAVVLDDQSNPIWPSLLGTGGNDGNLDFTNNFMQQLGGLFDLEDPVAKPRPIAATLLHGSLWTEAVTGLSSSAIGQYQPGSAGGANSSTGFDSGNMVNPWDFVLMLEGTLLFQAEATRRLDPNSPSQASAPFALYAQAAGFATPGDEKSQRGEQWMPLWRQPSTFKEVARLLGEGRLQLGRRTASRPIDAARAISRLGVARGIDQFVRYGYLERNGQSNLAVPLGTIRVQHHPRSFLIDDLSGWLDRLNRAANSSNAPASFKHAERRLADAVFAALTHDYSPDRWQAILIAAAEIEQLQASGTAFEAGPIPQLRSEWIAAIAEDSAEFRLALSLGSAAAHYSKQGAPIDSIRYHFLPLERGDRKYKTQEKRLAKDPRVVASGRDPIRDLVAIAERRLIESEREGQRRLPLVAANGCTARPTDLARFVDGNLDYEKLLALSRGLMAVRWKDWDPRSLASTQVTQPVSSKRDSSRWPDECWMAIRLGCLPWPVRSDLNIPADQRLVRLLISGDSERAVALARQRLQSVGIRPPMQSGLVDPASARLWAAALALPISRKVAHTMVERLDPRQRVASRTLL